MALENITIPVLRRITLSEEKYLQQIQLKDALDETAVELVKIELVHSIECLASVKISDLTIKQQFVQLEVNCEQPATQIYKFKIVQPVNNTQVIPSNPKEPEVTSNEVNEESISPCSKKSKNRHMGNKTRSSSTERQLLVQETRVRKQLEILDLRQKQLRLLRELEKLNKDTALEEKPEPKRPKMDEHGLSPSEKDTSQTSLQETENKSACSHAEAVQEESNKVEQPESRTDVEIVEEQEARNIPCIELLSDSEDEDHEERKQMMLELEERKLRLLEEVADLVTDAELSGVEPDVANNPRDNVADSEHRERDPETATVKVSEIDQEIPAVKSSDMKDGAQAKEASDPMDDGPSESSMDDSLDAADTLFSQSAPFNLNQSTNVDIDKWLLTLTKAGALLKKSSDYTKEFIVRLGRSVLFNLRALAAVLQKCNNPLTSMMSSITLPILHTQHVTAMEREWLSKTTAKEITSNRMFRVIEMLQLCVEGLSASGIMKNSGRYELVQVCRENVTNIVTGEVVHMDLIENSPPKSSDAQCKLDENPPTCSAPPELSAAVPPSVSNVEWAPSAPLAICRPTCTVEPMVISPCSSQPPPLPTTPHPLDNPYPPPPPPPPITPYSIETLMYQRQPPFQAQYPSVADPHTITPAVYTGALKSTVDVSQMEYASPSMCLTPLAEYLSVPPPSVPVPPQCGDMTTPSTFSGPPASYPPFPVPLHLPPPSVYAGQPLGYPPSFTSVTPNPSAIPESAGFQIPHWVHPPPLLPDRVILPSYIPLSKRKPFTKAPPHIPKTQINLLPTPAGKSTKASVERETATVHPSTAMSVLPTRSALSQILQTQYSPSKTAAVAPSCSKTTVCKSYAPHVPKNTIPTARESNINVSPPREEETFEAPVGAELHITGLPKTMTEEELRFMLLPFGKASGIKVYTSSVGATATGFVSMQTRKQTKLVLSALNNLVLPLTTNPITVRCLVKD